MSCNAAWSMLYPYNYITNYGGRVQFNLIDPAHHTPQEAYAMRNAVNPFFYLTSLCNGLASANSPDLTSAMFANAGSVYGANAGANTFNAVSIQNISGNISSMKAQLDQALASDKLTSAQKNELRAMKRELEALEDKLEGIQFLQSRGASAEQVHVALSQIKAQYRVLRDNIQEIADQIRESLVEEETEDVEEGNNNGGNGNEGGNENTENTENPLPHIGQVDTTTFNPDMYAANVEDDNVIEIVNTIYQKVDGCGSGGIRRYMNENITKDNVVEVMLHWNKHYAEMYAEDDALGLTETLMDEAFAGGRKNCTALLEALEARLQDYKGVNSELYGIASSQLAIARREHDATFWTTEDKMSDAINKAHAAITELMFLQAQQPEQAQ